MIFKPATGSRLSNEQAQRYGERIEVLVEEYNGSVTPEAVLADARLPDSPLHDFFEWDNSIAAEAWRMNQARYLMRSIHVVIQRDDSDNGEEEARYLYNVHELPPEKEEPQSVYVAIQRVLSEAEVRQQVIEQALRQLTYWRNRYTQYNEFGKIFSAIAEVEQGLGI